MIDAYRLLLRLFPADFRARFGADMTTLFAGRLADARERGATAVAALWLRTVADMLTHGLNERRAQFFGGLGQDVRFAFRLFRRRPGFAAATVVTLAVGVGANVAVFSTIRAVLIDELQYRDPDRLVRVWQVMTRAMPQGFSVGDYEVLRSRLTSFSPLAGGGWTRALIRGEGLSEQVTASYVTPGFFEVFGVSPMLGRTLGDADFQPGDLPVVISADVWKSQFGRDPNVVGKTLRLDRQRWTVVGVMPPSFCATCIFGRDPIVWRPARWTPAERASRSTVMYLFGRLAPAATPTSAQAELDVVMADRLRERNDPPSDLYFTGAALQVLGEREALAVRPGLLLLQGITAFLLLISSANLANLFLAHASARRREFGVRSALGAGRHRLIRQLLTEAAVIATGGGGLGVALAYWTIPLLESLAAPVLPPGTSITMRTMELGVGLALSWLTVLVFGTVPSLVASKVDVLDALRSAAHATAGRTVRALRASLVAAEVGLAIVVLTGAGLLIKSFANIVAIPVGFEPAGLVGADIRLTSSPNDERPPGSEHFLGRLTDEIRARVSADPIAFSNASPFEVGATVFDPWRLVLDGQAWEMQRANIRSISTNYFEVVGVPLRRGRLLDAGDETASPSAAVVSEAFVATYGGGQDLLGARIVSGNSAWVIVGIVGDTVATTRHERPLAAFYVPLGAHASYSVSVLIRTRNEREAIAAIRDSVHTIDPDMPLMRVESLATTVARSEQRRHFYLAMVSLFGGLSGLLATVGIYGVVSHVTGQRTREMGIRLALGARPAALKRLIVGQGLVPVAVGMAGGLACAWWVTRLLETNAVFSSQLYQVTTHDPWTFALATAGLAAVALIACWIAAWRTSRVDPVSVLRAE